MENTNLILNPGVLELGKVELQTYGKAEAEKLIEAGWADPIKLLVQSKKYLEILTAFNKAMKEAAITSLELSSGKAEVGNAKVDTGAGPSLLDYAEDPIYVELKQKIDQRVELLKTAKKMKDPIYDNMGIEVPRVGFKTQSGTTIRITL